MGLVNISSQTPCGETEKIPKDVSSSITHIKKLSDSNWHTWEPTFIDCLQRVHKAKEILYGTITPGDEEYDEDLDKALVGLIHACCDNSPDSRTNTYTIRGADEEVQLGSTLYAKLKKALTLNDAVKQAGLQDRIHTVHLYNRDVVKLGKELNLIWNDVARLGKRFDEDLALGGVSCLRTAHNCAPQNFKSTRCALTPTHSKFTLLKCGNANKFIFAGAAQFEQRTAGAAHTLLEQRNFSNTLLESNTQLEQHTARAAHTLLEQCNLSSALLESNAQLEQRTARAAHTLLQQRNFSNALLKSNAQLEQRTHSSRAMQSSSPTLALTPHNCSALQHLCRHHQPPLQS
ncbi:uncharacterized protein UDID_18106 [Ustilago sp. UG-2017a]|nr:uncharacterized protein UDID_18106 [Ustilago sp. UG-2017a]